MTTDSWKGDALSALTRLGWVEEDSSGLVLDLRTGEPVIVDSDSHRRAVPFVDLVGGYRASREQLLATIAEVLDRGDFVLGEAVVSFEQQFAAYCGVGHGVGVDSGFSALELILRAMGIGPGDEVITVANTFIATVNAIHHAGATPVLVDMDPTTYNIDPEQVEAAITPRTAGILAVHLYGRPADMAPLRAIADRHGLALIEDACQAHGATYAGRRAGSLGHAAAFSFYPSKNLGAFGDGGMVVTDSEELAAQVRLLRNVGSVEKYHHQVRGFNRRLDTLQAAVLSHRLETLDDENAARRRHAALYQALLDDLPVRLPATPEEPDRDHVYHLYVIETEMRAGLIRHLEERHIATGIHYPIPVHLQPAYADLPYRPGAFPVTEAAAARILSLPMYPGLTLDAGARVARFIREFFQG